MRTSTTEKTIINTDEVMNDAFVDLLTDYSKRLIVMYGGAGSGKSVAAAQIIVISMLQGRNQLIVRKVARTLRQSVFSEVLKAMNQFEVSDLFKVNFSGMTIRCETGAVAYFIGCDDAEKIKSITPPDGMFNDIHIEEATEISEDDLLLIDSRQRGDSDLPRRMFLRFNPIYSSHWLKKELFDSNKYDCLLHKTTCLDNKFLSDLDKERYENYKNQSQYMYDVYYLGNWGILGGVIFSYEVVTEKPDFMRGAKAKYGLDFGWIDETGIIRVYSNSRYLYIDDEIYKTKLTYEMIANKLKTFAKGQPVTCDNAEPRGIKKLQEAGIIARPAKKGKGSVISGIRHIQTKKLLVHERCVNTIKELDAYHFKNNKDGEEIEVPEATNDHLIDALRYALEDEIRGGKTEVGFGKLDNEIGWPEWNM